MFYKKCIIYTIIELNSKHYYKQLFLELQHKQYDLLFASDSTVFHCTVLLTQNIHFNIYE